MSEIKREVYICQGCKKPLFEETDGFVVQGNIFVANGQGGLIGNAFPINEKNESDFRIDPDEIKQYPLCTKCFYDATFGCLEEDGKCFVRGVDVDDIPMKGCHIPATGQVKMVPDQEVIDSWEGKRKAFGLSNV